MTHVSERRALRPRPGCQTSRPSGCPHPYSPCVMPTPPAEGFLRPCPSSKTAQPKVPSQTQALVFASVGPPAGLSSLAATSFSQERMHGIRSLPIHHDVSFLSLNLTFKACVLSSLFCQVGILTAHMLTAEHLQRTKHGASLARLVRTQSSHHRVYVFQGMNSPISTQPLSQRKYLSLSSPLKASPQPSSTPLT